MSALVRIPGSSRTLRHFRNVPVADSIDAITLVAPIVRFNALDILFAPALDFAIVFNVRTSVAVHGRLTTLFFLAKFRFLF